jgi:hypothetical protein
VQPVPGLHTYFSLTVSPLLSLSHCVSLTAVSLTVSLSLCQAAEAEVRRMTLEVEEARRNTAAALKQREAAQAVCVNPTQVQFNPYPGVC